MQARPQCQFQKSGATAVMANEQLNIARSSVITAAPAARRIGFGAVSGVEQP
jgi:hypothetical protein